MKTRASLFAALLAATGAVSVAQAPPDNPVLAPAAGAIVVPASSPAVVAAPGALLPPTGWTAQQAAEVFLRVDTNRDGSLSRAEARAITNARLDFEALDTNKDGLLSRSEFEAGVR